ncbi:MAG: tyrosine-type recombinase/integrase [Chloroflexi bacterium]|nr:tyrosine-type recombinase/integrase [Chloroflexota bacterium]
MNDWLPNFTTEIQRLLGYSPTTAKAYTSDVSRFLDYLARYRGKNILTDRITADDVTAFLAYEVSQGRRRTTLHRRLAALRVLERYLLLTDQLIAPFVPKDATVLQTLLESKPSRATSCLQTEDLQRLWQTLLQSPKRQAVRDLALIALIAEWGFPISLLLSLTVDNIDLDERLLWVPQITGRQIAWELEHAYGPVARYLTHGRQDLAPKANVQHLFISQQGRPLSRQSVWHSLRMWGQEAGLSIPLTPRVLRNTAAYRLLRSGYSPQAIGQALGHSNPLSTTLLIRRLYQHCGDKPPAEIPEYPAQEDTPAEE